MAKSTKGTNLLLISKGIKNSWLDWFELLKQATLRSKKKMGQREYIPQFRKSIQVKYSRVVKVVIKMPFISSPYRKWEEPIFLSVQYEQTNYMSSWNIIAKKLAYIKKIKVKNLQN